MAQPGTWEHWIDRVITYAHERHRQPKIWQSERFLDAAQRAFKFQRDPLQFTDEYVKEQEV